MKTKSLGGAFVTMSQPGCERSPFRNRECASRWTAPQSCGPRVRQIMKDILIALAVSMFAANGISAQEIESDEDRPFDEGGIYDKPYLTRLRGRTHIGGYTETAFRFEREEGVKEELSFEMVRFNLFTFARVSDRLRVAAEIEFEEGGNEITMELAIIDFEIHPSLNFRAGILLSPLGKFNLAHDSPANEVTDRPLVSTQIIPTTLSEPGMGFYGELHPTTQSRLTYELYLVNGFHTGVLVGSPDGSRVPAGKANFEDNNAHPSFVGRLGLSPVPKFEVGISTHTGPYNVWTSEGLTIDQRRDVTIMALDAEGRWGHFGLMGEYARAMIDVPEESGGIFASDQSGFYAQGMYRFLEGRIAALPASRFAAVLRYDVVDFDLATDGDSGKRVTFGVNFRPTDDTVFKVDYQHNWIRDPFNTQVRAAAILFSVASYF